MYVGKESERNCEKIRNSMEIWRKIFTKIYLLLRPEFLMIGKSKESKEGNSYTETVLKRNLKKELAP